MNGMILYPASCAGPILKGTTKPIVAVLSASGTPGYVYKLYVQLRV